VPAFTTTALILMAAGTATSVYGQVRAGRAARKAGEAARESSDSQADLADYNAAVAELQAQDALERGAEDEARFRTNIRGAIGAQRANIAAGNIDVSFGSAVDVQADAAFLGELDALTLRTNAGREAWGYQVQAEDYRARARIARKEGVYLERSGRVEQTTHNINAVGSLVSGGASLMQQRYAFQTSTGD
jgi:hypothetical protein